MNVISHAVRICSTVPSGVCKNLGVNFVLQGQELDIVIASTRCAFHICRNTGKMSGKKNVFIVAKKNQNLVALRFPHAPDNVVQQESNNMGNYN